MSEIDENNRSTEPVDPKMASIDKPVENQSGPTIPSTPTQVDINSSATHTEVMQIELDLKGKQLLHEEDITEFNILRTRNPQWRPNLQDEDLSGKNLTGVDLHLANLHGTNFHASTLIGANFRAAEIGKNTSFRSCDLTGCNFVRIKIAKDTDKGIFLFADTSAAKFRGPEAKVLLTPTQVRQLDNDSRTGRVLNMSEIMKRLETQGINIEEILVQCIEERVGWKILKEKDREKFKNQLLRAKMSEKGLNEFLERREEGEKWRLQFSMDTLTLVQQYKKLFPFAENPRYFPSQPYDEYKICSRTNNPKPTGKVSLIAIPTNPDFKTYSELELLPESLSPLDYLEEARRNPRGNSFKFPEWRVKGKSRMSGKILDDELALSGNFHPPAISRIHPEEENFWHRCPIIS